MEDPVTITQASGISEPVPVPLDEVDRELSRQKNLTPRSKEQPVHRACMSNLVICCNKQEQFSPIAAVLPEVVAVHPSRVLLLVGDATAPTSAVKASVMVRQQRVGGHIACSEQIILEAHGQTSEHLPYAVRHLLIGDLPINLWWAAPIPPPLAGNLFYELVEQTQQVIYDSIGWTEPARGVAATAAWLAKFERRPGESRWRVASDLNWRRLKTWRRILGQALDSGEAAEATGSISEVLVEHGPHAVIQAWELVSWLASRLGWEVRAGRLQPGKELAWEVVARHGPLRLCIRRLADGPSEIRRLRIACKIANTPTAINLTVQDERRLAVEMEGLNAAPRTLNIKPYSYGELVGRQLSDRERDPVFRESMEVAQVLAKSVLG
jgi:glucose-6-phosphate dehydrogenase assembly protein OpcA